MVFDQVKGKLDAGFEDRGMQHLKNIADPIRTYRVTSESVSHAPPAHFSMPAKPSIAVLPFDNMSDDHAQEYFSDGISEDLTTALSRFEWLFVIARNSAFTYKGKAVDVRRVRRELGVRYVLEGSVRREGDRVRFTGQLIDATSALHIWADRLEGNLGDVFTIQDRFTECVVAMIEPKVQLSEIERIKHTSAKNLAAYDLFLRALRREY